MEGKEWVAPEVVGSVGLEGSEGSEGLVEEVETLTETVTGMQQSVDIDAMLGALAVGAS